ncbi:MAG: helix-turn-helix transcriptional regulator [Lautropia sp.]
MKASTFDTQPSPPQKAMADPLAPSCYPTAAEWTAARLAYFSERYRLTPRERETLGLYVAGHGLLDVARLADMRPESAASYLRRVRMKVWVETMSALVSCVLGGRAPPVCTAFGTKRAPAA